jgi:hypothetical protein
MSSTLLSCAQVLEFRPLDFPVPVFDTGAQSNESQSLLNFIACCTQEFQLSVLTSPMTQQPALFLRIALTLAPSCQALHVSRFHGVALSEDNRTADRHHFLELFV